MKKIAEYEVDLSDEQLQTIKMWAHDSIVVQDACNLSGVCYSLPNLIIALRGMFKDWEVVDHHPTVKMFVHKIGSMTGVDTSHDDFSAAYEEVRRICEFKR